MDSKAQTGKYIVHRGFHKGPFEPRKLPLKKNRMPSLWRGCALESHY